MQTNALNILLPGGSLLGICPTVTQRQGKVKPAVHPHRSWHLPDWSVGRHPRTGRKIPPSRPARLEPLESRTGEGFANGLPLEPQIHQSYRTTSRRPILSISFLRSAR